MVMTPTVKEPNPRGIKNQAVWTSSSLLDNGVVYRNSCGLWTGWALEGLLGWVVVECCWHVRPLFQLVVLQMKFLRETDSFKIIALILKTKKIKFDNINSYLGYFPPVKTIKKVVGTPLIGVSLQCRLHTRCPSYPNPFLFVVPPVPVKAGE